MPRPAGAALAWLSMTGHASRLWTDRSWLRDVQYRTEAYLAARQSLYAHQHPRLNLPGWAFGLAALTGAETVADVGRSESYLRSMNIAQAAPDPEQLVVAVLGGLRRGRDGTIRVRAHTGCLIGR